MDLLVGLHDSQDGLERVQDAHGRDRLLVALLRRRQDLEDRANPKGGNLLRKICLIMKGNSYNVFRDYGWSLIALSFEMKLTINLRCWPWISAPIIHTLQKLCNNLISPKELRQEEMSMYPLNSYPIKEQRGNFYHYLILESLWTLRTTSNHSLGQKFQRGACTCRQRPGWVAPCRCRRSSAWPTSGRRSPSAGWCSTARGWSHGSSAPRTLWQSRPEKRPVVNINQDYKLLRSQAVSHLVPK